jgi:hypothetical protein
MNVKIKRIQVPSDQYAKMIKIMSDVTLDPENENKRSIFMEHKLEIDTMAGSLKLLGSTNSESAEKLKNSFLKIYVNVYRTLNNLGVNIRPGPIDSKYESPSSMDRYQ